MPSRTPPFKQLNNGVKIPIIGLGLFEVSGEVKASRVIRDALEIGYRRFDTASIYQNEQYLGEVISHSGIPRRELFITTKLWNSDHGYESTFRAFDRSLANLGVDYIDLFLVHWPVERLRIDTWNAMAKLFEAGKCRAIGVSNYTIAHLEELIKVSPILPTINQVEFNPFLYQKKLLDFCRAKNILIEAYSPLTQGRKLRHPRLITLSKKYHKSTAQLLIRWAIEHNVLVIPKSTKREHLEENLDVFDFAIEREDLVELDNLNENFRVNWDPSNAP